MILKEEDMIIRVRRLRNKYRKILIQGAKRTTNDISE
jgi:predicted DNA-binding protein (UPF0278 family)